MPNKEIILSNGNICIVSKIDFNKINKYKWHFCKIGYAVARINKKLIYMHRLIMNPKKGIDIDHIDYNGLNNCRNNLRCCTRKENLRRSRKRKGNYTSKYKGVFYDKERNKWRSEITIDYKNIYLGRFKTEQDAKEAYNNAAIKYFGEFSNINL